MPAGYPGAAGGGGRGPGGDGDGLTGGGAPGTVGAAGDFSTAMKGAQSFLAAAQAKDATALSEATAKRAEFLAGAARIELFKAVLSQTATTDMIEQLARDFDGMKVMDVNTRKSSGSVEVIVGKDDTQKNNRMSRHLVMRKEKDGWKVLDYTGLRETNPSKKSRSR